METYVIYYDYTDTTKKYIGTIYRNSISSDNDMGDALKFDDKDTALKVASYLNRRDNSNKYKVLCVKTTVEEVK